MKGQRAFLALIMALVMFLVTPLNIAAAARAASALTFTSSPAVPASTGVSVPVTGKTSQGGKFTGTFNIQQFGLVNNQLMAMGTLTGTVENGVGNPIGTVLTTAAMPVTSKQSTCQILTLDLGPLDLNLLGLMVHLNEVVLNITADPTGGLLGSLLCSLANTTLLTNIVSLLNQILALL